MARGLSAVAAFIAAGYAKSGAKSNAFRLMENDGVLARIEELKTAVAERVVATEIGRRSFRMLQLQNQLENMLRLQRERAVMYGGQMGESHEFQVNTPEEEAAAVADGCHELKRPYYGQEPSPQAPPAAPPAPISRGADAFKALFSSIPPPMPGSAGSPASEAPAPPRYPKTMVHPGYPNGGGTGMLVKDYRGKNAEQEIWKFDGGLVAKILEAMKQAAIEEGEWDEKRDKKPENTVTPKITVVFVTPPAVRPASVTIDALPGS